MSPIFWQALDSPSNSLSSLFFDIVAGAYSINHGGIPCRFGIGCQGGITH